MLGQVGALTFDKRRLSPRLALGLVNGAEHFPSPLRDGISDNLLKVVFPTLVALHDPGWSPDIHDEAQPAPARRTVAVLKPLWPPPAFTRCTPIVTVRSTFTGTGSDNTSNKK